jgi:eukaryotic translation initiation factor 2C
MGLSFFHPQLGQTGELGNGIEYWRGYYQFLRPTQMGLSLTVGIASLFSIGDSCRANCFNKNCTDITLLLTFDSHVADVSARAFYEPILVTEFVAKYFNFDFSRQLSDQDRQKVTFATIRFGAL